RIDNNPVNGKAELMEIVGQKNPGDKVTVVVLRDGRESELALTMTSEEAQTAGVKDNKLTYQGATFQTLSQNEKQKYNIDFGFKITALQNGKFKNAGIGVGFILLTVDRKPIRTTLDLKEALTSRQGGILIEGIYPNGLRAYYGIGL
ncbi:MAG: deoxyribonuclease HsdR, partial [Bacteroidota bacterium]